MAFGEKLSDNIVLEKCDVCPAKKLSQKRVIAKSKNCKLPLNSNLTLFYDALPFCKIWMKLLHPFESNWSETTV